MIACVGFPRDVQKNIAAQCSRSPASMEMDALGDMGSANSIRLAICNTIEGWEVGDFQFFSNFDSGNCAGGVEN